MTRKITASRLMPVTNPSTITATVINHRAHNSKLYGYIGHHFRPGWAHEGRSPSVTHRFESDIHQFLELDETRQSLNGFVPIPCPS